MLKQAYDRFFGTLGSQNRLAIIKALQNKTPLSVNEIVARTGLEQSVASRHLKLLRECSFVFVKQNGKERHYRLNQKTIKPLLSLIDRHVERYCSRCVDK